eukprot:jgi/Botrbrau1/12382/Bobra.0084s0005.1
MLSSGRGSASQIISRCLSSSSVEAPVFIVFGASGGIGSELVAQLLSLPGSRVVAAGRNEEKVKGLVELLNVDGRLSHAVYDSSSSKSVQETVENAVKLHGRLDGAANCVGNVVLRPAHTTSEEDFMNCFSINTLSAFNVIKGTVRQMMKGGGGSIALCSSAVAFHGTPNHEAIAAAKGGVAALALSAASTYAPYNIRVNTVAPGLIRTPMTARITSNQNALKASESMHALGRIGAPSDIAAALSFFLNPSNAFITGAYLNVDGGLGTIKPLQRS